MSKQREGYFVKVTKVLIGWVSRGESFMSMSISIQKSSKRTNIKHNNRTMNEKDQQRNTHIDLSRSHENVYLVQQDIKELYREEFGEALEMYNAKQKRSDRKIDDYFKHIQASKKTAVQQELIIQVGDKDDFSSSENREQANDVLKEWFHEFEERNPNLKIYNAVIHNDEASPHLHMNFVPVASDYKRGLEKQVSFDRAILQQDATLQKERPFDQWREREVGFLEKRLAERGIERKLVGKNNYADVQEYKKERDKIKELERKIDTLDTTLDTKSDELAKVKTKYEHARSLIPSEPIQIEYEKNETEIEIVKKGFMQKEEIEKQTGNFVLTPAQMKKANEQINAATLIKSQYDIIRKMDMVKELAHAQAKNKDFKKENQLLSNKVSKLEQDNQSLKAHVNDLKGQISILYDSSKEFLKERTDNVRAFKKVLGDYIDKFKEKRKETLVEHQKQPEISEIEKIHRSSLKKERGMDMER